MTVSRWLVGLALLGLALARPAAAAWLSEEEAIMGTAVRVELWDEDETGGRAAIAAVMAEMHRIDELMSPFKETSELSRVNREAAKGPVRITRELYDLIRRSIEFSKLTDGAFDITFSSVGYLYDYRKGVHPSDAEIQQHLGAINYRHLVLDPEARTIRFARAGVRIDLGGIAKGYAIDTSLRLLKARGIRSAIVTAGGDSGVLGDHQGRPWMIGIRDPRDRADVVAVLPLANSYISTSGDYERYFERDGVRYHHIINPKTGKSVSGVHSVSVIGPDGTTTDALSTSVFVMGVERGLRLVEALPDVEAVIIDSAGRMHFSSGLKNVAERRAPAPAQPR